eukprot:c16575_g1_i1 orf=311-745(+)
MSEFPTPIRRNKSINQWMNGDPALVEQQNIKINGLTDATLKSSKIIRNYSVGCLSKGQMKTPSGYIALDVGPERARFFIRIDVLNHPDFKALLDEAQEQCGFTQRGVLAIPCDISFFKQTIDRISNPQNQCSMKNVFMKVPNFL